MNMKTSTMMTMTTIAPKPIYMGTPLVFAGLNPLNRAGEGGG
jgi:hypothetical protein